MAGRRSFESGQGSAESDNKMRAYSLVTLYDRRVRHGLFAASLVFFAAIATRHAALEARVAAAGPFTVQRIAAFSYPWRIAFLPDGRMLVTEKPGRLWLVTPAGAKTRIAGVPAVHYEGQAGLLGIYLAPDFAQHRDVYLTYAEPGGRGSGLALARATLALGAAPRLDGLRVVWREFPKGRGGSWAGRWPFPRTVAICS